MVLIEHFRVSDGLPNRSFCRSDISRVQLKLHWTVCKKLLASDSKTVCKSRLILSKAQLLFFNDWFGNRIISKELTLKSCWMLCSTGGTAQKFRWPGRPIMLSMGHFKIRTEVHRRVGEWLLASDQEAVGEYRVILLKRQWTFS